jgi:hypothetical protein
LKSIVKIDHLVCIDESSREVVIYRIAPDGHRVLFTRASLPDGSGWTDELRAFASMLGENLLIDSPIARDLLEI